MKIINQLAIIISICFFSYILSIMIPLPFPGNVISIIIMFLLLLAKAIKIEYVDESATFLFKNMSFFLIPAGVGIIETYSEIKEILLIIIFISIVTTIITFIVTVYAVTFIVKLINRGG